MYAVLFVYAVVIVLGLCFYVISRYRRQHAQAVDLDSKVQAILASDDRWQYPQFYR